MNSFKTPTLDALTEALKEGNEDHRKPRKDSGTSVTTPLKVFSDSFFNSDNGESLQGLGARSAKSDSSGCLSVSGTSVTSRSDGISLVDTISRSDDGYCENRNSRISTREKYAIPPSDRKAIQSVDAPVERGNSLSPIAPGVAPSDLEIDRELKIQVMRELCGMRLLGSHSASAIADALKDGNLFEVGTLIWVGSEAARAKCIQKYPKANVKISAPNQVWPSNVHGIIEILSVD